MQKQSTSKKKNSIDISSLHKFYKTKLLNYLKTQQKMNKKQQVSAKEILYQLLNQELNNDQNTTKIQRLLDDIQHSLWNYYIPVNFFVKICQHQKLQSILTSLLMITDGHFESNQSKELLNILQMPYDNMYQCFFLFAHKQNYYILFEVGLKNDKQEKEQKNNLLLQELKHTITFLDIFFCYKQQEIYNSALNYQLDLQQNFNWIQNKIICISPKTPSNSKTQQYLFNPENKGWPQLLFNSNQNQQWKPLIFEKMRCSLNDLYYNESKKQYEDKIFIKQQLIAKKIKEIAYFNYNIIKQYQDFELSQKLIQFLQKSPVFKIRLSQEESKVIESQENCLVIGRSGTGKTTCSALTIFISQYQQKIRRKFLNLEEQVFVKDYDDQDISIRNIFITVNQKLVDKVEEYYQKLKFIIIEMVIKAKKDSLNDNQIENCITDNEIINAILKDEEVQEINDKKQNIQFIQKNQGDFQNLNTLKFPCFLSTLNLLILMDQKLQFPYFSKDRIEKFKKKYQIEVGIKFYNAINISKYFDNLDSNQKINIPEISFNLFYEKYWSKKQNINLNKESYASASLIWTQINSLIKGSQFSYKYSNYALPIQKYKERVSNNFSEQQIQNIYKVYVDYEKWKNDNLYIDQIDIVNNMLFNMENNPILLFPLHNMYIDEVQDIPQAMIGLFNRLTEQKVVYSGDAAQSILKGIGFRFEDLEQQFRNTKKVGINTVEQFQVHKLMINFRTHNSILQLANCIVRLLELLFPFSIDKLAKEISNIQGPKPQIFMKSQLNLMLSKLKDEYIGDDCQQVEFGYNQVVIVRDEQAKEKLPQLLDDAQVFTIFQAKGLEFDDVIMYNFFAQHEFLESQWELLQCIDIEDQLQDKMIYENQITKHKNQESDLNSFEINQNGKVKIKQIKLNQRINKKNINDYSSICEELKALYVIITRTKKRLYIYDVNPTQRKEIERIFQQLQVCDIIQQNDNECKFQMNNQKQAQQQKFIEDIEINTQIWEKQGYLYFENIEMFQKTQNNQYMIDLCQAQVFLEKGKQKKMYYKILKNQQQENNQFNQIEIDQAYSAYRKYFQDAAILFENKLNDQIIAANSYYSGKYFEQSIIIFLNKNKLPEAAKAAEKAQLTLMAAIIQLKLSNIDKCISLLRIDVDNSCFYLEVLNYAKKNNLINHSKLKEELQFIEKSQNNIFKQLPQMKIQHNLEDLCNSYIRTRTQFINTFNKQIKLFLNSSFKQNDWYTNLFDTVQIFSNIIIEEVKRQSIKKENSYFQFLENEFQKSLIDYANRDIQYFVVSYLEAIECFELLKILKTNRTHLYQLELSPHDPNNLINKIGSQLDLQYFIFKKKMFYLSEDQLQYYNSQKYKQINDTQFQIFLLTHVFHTFQTFQKQNQDGLSQCKKKIENELNSKSYVKILFCVEQELQIQEFQKLLQNMLNNNNQTQNIVDITLKKLNKVFSLNLNNQLKHLEELFNIDFKQDHIKQVEQYTTLFYVLFKFHFENRKMDEIFENISLQACFKIMFLLLSGSLLYQFDFRKNFQNSLFRAISIVFKIYIFQSDSLNFIGQAFAVIQKDSYLKLFNKEGSINLEGGCYLFDSIKVIQQIQKKFINLIFNIKPTQICTKLIFQNEKEKKLVKIEVTKEEELIFIESLKKLMQKTKQEKENKNKNKKENKNNLLKVIINLNFLLSFTNISLNNNFQFLQAVDVSYHLRFYEVKRNCVSIFAIILWFKFIQSKSVRSDFLSLYQDVQLQYEVTYIVLCLLLSFASLKENNHIKLDVTEFEFIKFQEQQINQEEKEEGIDTESSKAQKNEDRIEFWKKYSDAYVKLKKLYYDEENQQNIQNPIKYMQFNLILTRELFEYIQIHLYQNEELILDNNNFMKDFATFPLLCECVLKVIINIILKSRENQEHNLNYYLKLFKVLIINLKQLTIDQTNIFSQNLLNIFQELEKEKILNHDIMTDTKNILHQFMSSDGIFGIVESYSLNTNYSQNYTKVKQDETNSLITYYKLRMNLTGKSTLEDKKVEKVYQKIYQLKSFLNEVALNANLNFYEFSQINELIYDIDLLEKSIDQNKQFQKLAQYNERLSEIIQNIQKWLKQEHQEKKIWDKHQMELLKFD